MAMAPVLYTVGLLNHISNINCSANAVWVAQGSNKINWSFSKLLLKVVFSTFYWQKTLF